MPYTHAQTSFAAGELSPFLYSRVDLAKYVTGVKTSRNFYQHPHGGSSNRPGMKLVARQGDETTKARVIPFIFSDTEAYTLEFGDHYIRFFTDQGQITADTPTTWSAATTYAVDDWVTYGSATSWYLSIQAGINKQPDVETAYWKAQTEYEIYSPYGYADLPYLDVKSSADVIYIFHPDYQTRKLVRSGNASWAFSLFAPQDGPFLTENVDESVSINAAAVTGTGVTLSAASAVFDSDHVDALWKLIHYVEGQAASSSFTGTGSGTAIKCFTTWRIISHGTWTGKFKIEKSTDGGTTWTVLRVFTGANDFNVNTYGTEDIEINEVPFLIRATCHAFTSGTINVDLTTDPFYQEGIIEITEYVSTTAVKGTVLQEIAAITDTTSWAEGAWSDYRGWPSVGAFQDDRLCAGGTYTEPMTLKMSKTGNYESFGKNQISLLDTDSISTNLLSRQINTLNGLVPLGDLIGFTTASEWRIGSGDDVLTPTTVRTKVQGYRGSSGITPVVIGNQVIFVQANGKVIRNLGYDDASASFTGIDLRVLSEHLLEGHTVIDMAYQQDPDSIVWILRDDGILLSLTYMQEHEVIAWSWHETEGTIESICVIPATGYDELWLSVSRETGRFIERMVDRMSSTDVQDQYFVDCGISYDDPVAISHVTQADPGVVTCAAAHGLVDGDYVDVSDIVGMTELNTYRYKVNNATADTFELTEEDSGDDVSTTLNQAYVSGGYVRKAYTAFTGLDHLEGMTVAILGNGNVFPQDEVVSGTVTLSSACSKVHIGLPYICDLETLNIELALSSGSLQGKKVKIGNVTFRVLNTRGGYIGPDSDNLHEAFIPNRERLGLAPSLYSGDVREPLGGEFGDGARVFYRQIDPLPVTITAIYSDIEAGG